MPSKNKIQKTVFIIIIVMLTIGMVLPFITDIWR